MRETFESITAVGTFFTEVLKIILLLTSSFLLTTPGMMKDAIPI